jgi:PKD repeat protein
MKKGICILSLIAILAAFLSLPTGCSKSNNPACIDAPSGTIYTARPFTFTSSCSDPGITSYSWTFGDGSASVTTASVTHTYASSGTYTVTLIVVSNHVSYTTTRTVTVAPAVFTPQDFAGTYSVFDACQPTVQYNETVTVSGSTATIANLGNHGTNVTGAISGGNITIHSQNFYISGSYTWTVSGSGSLSANDTTLNISFTADSANVSNTCNVLGTK